MIKQTIILLTLFTLLLPNSLSSRSDKPESAQLILKNAVSLAQSSQKNVLLLFHATWCGWCKRLETALEDPEIKALIYKNYIVVMLDVEERGEKIQTHENPGGQDMKAEYGGKNAGLPFLVFLNGKGERIATSNVMPREQNIGYPGTKEEISAFITLLKKTAPHLTRKQCSVVQKYFEQHAPQ
ncbi:MAG: thioredoxin family protein [Ignavibacteriae bacterium]|nr:MAG: thioredoxin family protein [Ignavibacteriota bacterium]